jgi:hypothetical protein
MTIDARQIQFAKMHIRKTTPNEESTVYSFNIPATYFDKCPQSVHAKSVHFHSANSVPKGYHLITQRKNKTKKTVNVQGDP